MNICIINLFLTTRWNILNFSKMEQKGFCITNTFYNPTAKEAVLESENY